LAEVRVSIFRHTIGQGAVRSLATRPYLTRPDPRRYEKKSLGG